mmetsp:Transcript_33168/g.83658  ORF Transcript_33168/g.83658 Transcript_33168/m.83658 type:complete len:82 (-) Transcript_33168:45-290(-)
MRAAVDATRQTPSEGKVADLGGNKPRLKPFTKEQDRKKIKGRDGGMRDADADIVYEGGVNLEEQFEVDRVENEQAMGLFAN